MDLLNSAACNWNALINTHYLFVLGRKNKQYFIDLQFSPEDFSHIAGIQYANDVDLGLSQNERRGSRFFKAALSGRVTEADLQKSRKWARIESRLNIINNFENILENHFTITEFHPDRIRGYSRIDAKYVIKSQDGKSVFFILLDEETGKYFCRSAFKFEGTDYTLNQPVLIPLKITKYTNNSCKTIYINPRYVDDETT